MISYIGKRFENVWKTPIGVVYLRKELNKRYENNQSKISRWSAGL
jgi:hypothetical protein